MQKELQTERLVSLDTLRGFDMFLIVGGGAMLGAYCNGNVNGITQAIAKQMNHATWEGFAFWDIIMPLFMFVVGAAMPFSFAKRIGLGHGRTKLFIHVAKRVIILWVLGMMVQGNLLKYDPGQLQIYSNTLQAIAAGYLIASVLILNFSIIVQVIVTVGGLVGYWAVMRFVPFAGQGAGVMEPGNNIARYIEQMCAGQFFVETSTYTWFFSSITFGATVMLGVFAGFLLKNNKLSKYGKFFSLVGMGIVLTAGGMVWGIWLPIIKHIWTSSFVLYAGGLSYLMLAAFYLVIDVWGFKKWAFGFVVIGSNAIAAYMMAELFDFRHVGNIFVSGLEKFTGNWYELIQAAAAFVVLWLILFWMYRKKSFVKL